MKSNVKYTIQEDMENTTTIICNERVQQFSFSELYVLQPD